MRTKSVLEFIKNTKGVKARLSTSSKLGRSSSVQVIQSTGDTKEEAAEKLYVMCLANLEEAHLIAESVKKEVDNG